MKRLFLIIFLIFFFKSQLYADVRTYGYNSRDASWTWKIYEQDLIEFEVTIKSENVEICYSNMSIIQNGRQINFKAPGETKSGDEALFHREGEYCKCRLKNVTV